MQNDYTVTVKVCDKHIALPDGVAAVVVVVVDGLVASAVSGVVEQSC